MVIFDLDQTLVDTSPVADLRAARNWKAVMAKVPAIVVYPGIAELLSQLHACGQRLAILTKSPDMVAKAFITHHGWPIDIIVGYHQVKARKPNPEGLFLAMKQAGASAAETYHVGDDAADTEASRSAGVAALGSAWGLADTSLLIGSKPDEIFDSVAELSEYFRTKLPSPTGRCS